MNADQVVRKYLRHIADRLERNDLTEQVAANYLRDLEDYTKQFGKVQVEKLRQHDLTEFLGAHPSWKAVNTKRSRIASVLACFRWAREEELIPVCPYASPRALRGQIAETRRPATKEEFDTLMEFGSRPIRWALLFLFRTGCRTCEMRELTWDGVHLDGPQAAHLYLTKHKTFRRTGQPRIVGLDPLTVRLLRAIRRTSKNDHVFVNCDGFPWRKDSWCHHFRRLARRIGLDDGVVNRVSAYCLRHTYACDAIEAGFTSDQVGRALGHSSPDMVNKVYAKHVGQRVGFITDIAVGVSQKRS